ncbi:hypothetical protein B0H13DRAFT_2369765 [Mycena leptocephala]|nr:hypothetical protein B0H13DRAFT_2369765 [Mycena leptocephala]
MPTPSPPPLYREADPDELSRQLGRLSINIAISPNTAPTPPPQPPPAYTTTSAAASVALPGALYAYSTPQQTGFTPSWSEAAAATQGVPGASARSLIPRTRAPPKRVGRKGGYAVFCGLATGAFEHWLTEAGPLVLGVSNSIYKGYSTLALAQAAYQYALAQGWTRTLTRQRASFTVLSTVQLRGPLPTPNWLFDSLTPLHGDALEGRWYVVYRGVTPGVYQSSLECSLNTRGLSGSCYDSWDDKDVAIAHFMEELALGRVKILSPSMGWPCLGTSIITHHSSATRFASSLMSTNQTPDSTQPETQYQAMMRKKEERRAKTRARMAEYVITASKPHRPNLKLTLQVPWAPQAAPPRATGGVQGSRSRRPGALQSGVRSFTHLIPFGANLPPRHRLQIQVLTEPCKKSRQYRNFFPEDYAEHTTAGQGAPGQKRRRPGLA